MLDKKIKLKLVFVSLSILSSYILTTILKQLYMRPRPENIYGLTDYSFPSAHASLSIAVFISLFIILLPYFKYGLTRYFLEFLCLSFPVVIGLSRIFMHVHWVSDVLFGWFI
jgi:undecaprenyl-diphosphatase